MNRYAVSREISEIVKVLSIKYGIINNDNGVNVKIIHEKHLPDRVIDRGVDILILKRIIEKVVKYKVCETIYLCELNMGNGTRVGFKYRDLLLGARISKTENGNYVLKLSTVFIEERVKNNQHIKQFYIDITN